MKKGCMVLLRIVKIHAAIGRQRILDPPRIDVCCLHLRHRDLWAMQGHGPASLLQSPEGWQYQKRLTQIVSQLFWTSYPDI